MTTPPGSTPYVRFDTDPLTLLLRGADTLPGFVSPEMAAPGSTADVAFDTSPPLWFAFPAPATASTATASTTTASAGHRSSAPKRAARGRKRHGSRSALAATGSTDAPGVLGICVVGLAWVIRRRNARAES
jgi:hypothetical protein